MRALVQAGDGGGRARHRQLAHLRAGLLRLDRRADRAVQGRGAVPGQVHLAHAQRGQSPGRGRRRADSHQPRGRTSPPRSTTSRPPARRTGSRWTRSIAMDREGPRRRGWRSPPTCTPTPPARPASTRRCRRGCSTAATRPRSSASRTRRRARRSRTRSRRRRRTGRTSTSPPARRIASCSSSSSPRRSSR